jgi:hypothetical protein
MSYAGTYGPSETCPHDCYWKSCEYCSGIGPCPTPVQIAQARENQAQRKKHYLTHPDDARRVVPKERHVVVYDAYCGNPGCEWIRMGVSKEKLESDMATHLASAEHVARQWAKVDPQQAWVEP